MQFCQLVSTMSGKGQLHPVTDNVLGVCASPAPGLWPDSIQVWQVWYYCHIWCKGTSCRAPAAGHQRFSAASFQWKHTADATFPGKRAQSLPLLCLKTLKNLSCRDSHPWKCKAFGKKLLLTVLFTRENTGILGTILDEWGEDKMVKFSVIGRKLALLPRVKYNIPRICQGGKFL